MDSQEIEQLIERKKGLKKRWLLVPPGLLVLFVVFSFIQWHMPDTPADLSQYPEFDDVVFDEYGVIDVVASGRTSASAETAMYDTIRNLWPWLRNDSGFDLNDAEVIEARVKHLPSLQTALEVPPPNPINEFDSDLDEVGDGIPAKDGKYDAAVEIRLRLYRLTRQLESKLAQHKWQPKEFPRYAEYLEKIDAELVALEKELNREGAIEILRIVMAGPADIELVELTYGAGSYILKQSQELQKRSMLRLGSGRIEAALSDLEILTRFLVDLLKDRVAHSFVRGESYNLEQAWIEIAHESRGHADLLKRIRTQNSFIKLVQGTEPMPRMDRAMFWDAVNSVLSHRNFEAQEYSNCVSIPDMSLDSKSELQAQLLRGSADQGVAVHDLVQAQRELEYYWTRPGLPLTEIPDPFLTGIVEARDRLESGSTERLGFLLKGRRSRLVSDLALDIHGDFMVSQLQVRASYFRERQVRRCAFDVELYKAEHEGRNPETLEELLASSATESIADEPYLPFLMYTPQSNTGHYEIRTQNVPGSRRDEVYKSEERDRSVHDLIVEINGLLSKLKPLLVEPEPIKFFETSPPSDN